MKTIGQVIKSARLNKKLSVKKLGELTKIKVSFIKSIEEEKWKDLPTFPTVLGFVRSISAPLGIDEKMAMAVLKRDYPPQKTNISPKPDVSPKFTWSPKLTFIVSTIVVFLGVLGYLGYQYIKFISPPNLQVESPKENQTVNVGYIPVFGSTDTDVKITVNNQAVLVDLDGNFSVNLEVTESTKEINIVAISRSGKKRIVSRKITVQ